MNDLFELDRRKLISAGLLIAMFGFVAWGVSHHTTEAAGAKKKADAQRRMFEAAEAQQRALDAAKYESMKNFRVEQLKF